MAMPSSPALQKLYLLDASSHDFHKNLSSIISGEEYARCEKGLEPDDLQWLVDYLDEVRRRIILPNS